METEIGTVASLTQEAGEEQTPLEKRLERLGRRLIVLTFLMGVVVAVAGVMGGKDWVLVLETAIAMAVPPCRRGCPWSPPWRWPGGCGAWPSATPSSTASRPWSPPGSPRPRGG